MAGNVPVGKDDNVAFLAWSNVATTMHGNVWFLADGQKKPVQLSTPDFATGSTRALTSAAVKMPTNGTIIGVSTVAVSGGAVQRGQLFVQCLLTGATVNNVTVEQTLAQGYVYTGQVLGLGQIVEPGPAGGRGQLRTVSGTNQAAGVLPIDAMPVGSIRILRSYEVALVTDANAGNRQFALVIDNGTAAQRVFVAQNNNNQAATLTRTWAWYFGTDLSTSVGAALTDTVTVLPAYNLKDGLLLNGLDTLYNIRLVSTGALAFTATDDFAAPVFSIEEWVMPN